MQDTNIFCGLFRIVNTVQHRIYNRAPFCEFKAITYGLHFVTDANLHKKLHESGDQ